jgi:hypothetical protein
LFVPVLVCFALAACQPRQSASLHVSPQLEALVPADTVAVVGANLASLRDTAIYQKVLSRVPLLQLDTFTRETGLDPQKDFSEFLLCSNGKDALLLVRGKFRPADLESRFKSKGVMPVDYKGHAVFGADRGAITFLSDSVAVGGTPAGIHAVIDQPRGRSIPIGLRDLLRKLPADDQVYAALIGGIQNLNLPIPREGNLGNVLQSLRAVETATLGMNLSKGINAVAYVNCTTERDARFIHDMLRGLIGFGRLNTPDNQPDLLKVYDAIQVTQNQTEAKASADIPQDLTDKFLDLWLKK